jgi:mannose-1-phosphate guanylyltransferase
MPHSHQFGLIMAGGRGTRFWPRSRKRQAKQVLPVFGEKSLIRQAVDRLRPLLPPERIWVITSQLLREEIVQQIPEVPAEQVLAEPVQRNTAPCIGLAARIVHSLDPDAVMGIFPADHVILKPARFMRMLRPAFRAAAKGHLVVLGLQPRWAETGFGYIEFPSGVVPGSLDLYPVIKFREKPNVSTAKDFLASGRFYWNSGMFFWRADAYLRALRRHLPQTASVLDDLPPFRAPGFGESLQESFARCEDISVDYAVLERAESVMGLAAEDIGWNDIGAWTAAYDLSPKDRHGNALRTEALVENSTGNLVDVPGKLTALVGVRELIVIETPDALLITTRDQAQHVRELVKQLERKGRNDLL